MLVLKKSNSRDPSIPNNSTGRSMMRRRHFLLAGTATVGAIALSRVLSWRSTARTSTTPAFEVTKTEEEWRTTLTPAQFKVLRQQGTEPAFSSPLDTQFIRGTYHCAGCNLPVFSSETKFDSGTGWPSFYTPIADAIRTSHPPSVFITGTEVHCRRCGGHLGHRFEDGPPPTEKRYCINGVALQFVPA